MYANNQHHASRMECVRSIALTLFLCLLAACASRPVSTGPLPYADPATAATIHVYRPNDGPHGAALTFYLYIDGNRIASLASTQSTTQRLAPGRYDLSIQGELLGVPEAKPTKLQLEAESNKEYYARFSTRTTNIVVIGTAVSGRVERYFGLVPREAWQERR